MRVVLVSLALLVSSCYSNIIQTRGHSVSCYKGSHLELNTIPDPLYKLVFTGKAYELRLVDSNKLLATYTRCEIERVQPTPRFDDPDTR